MQNRSPQPPIAWLPTVQYTVIDLVHRFRFKTRPRRRPCIEDKRRKTASTTGAPRGPGPTRCLRLPARRSPASGLLRGGGGFDERWSDSSRLWSVVVVIRSLRARQGAGIRSALRRRKRTALFALRIKDGGGRCIECHTEPKHLSMVGGFEE